MSIASFSAPVIAQTWVKTYSAPTASSEWPANIVQTTDGGFLVSGKSPGAWIAKLDPVGNIQWSQSISGWGIWPQALETLDGGFALGNGVSVIGADGCYDVRFGLAKFTSSGVLQWHKQYGPDQVWSGGSCVGGQANARSIIETPDGSFLISGMIDNFNNGVIFDLWLVKVDSNGNVIWQKQYGSTEHDMQEIGGDKIGILPGGGIVLVGHGTAYSVGSNDVWVLWLDSDGEIVNQRAYGGIQDDQPVDLHVTDEGDVIISVMSQSWNGSHYKPWLLQLDSGGGIVSQRSYVLWNQFNMGFPHIVDLPNGNLGLAAQTNGDGSGLAEISADGSVLWSRYSYPETWGPWGGVTGISGGGFVMASLPTHWTSSTFFTLTRTDAVGSIDSSCPISDAGGSYIDTTAIITPSNVTAVTTSYPTVDMAPAFQAQTWDVVESCITLAPQILVNPAPVDFGSIPVGTTSSETVTVTNIGTANLLITSMSVGTPFSLTSSCAGFNLTPGTSCDATIEITPGATGAVSSVLSIGSDDPATPLLDVEVMASVVDPSFIFGDDFESGDLTAWGGAGS